MSVVDGGAGRLAVFIVGGCVVGGVCQRVVSCGGWWRLVVMAGGHRKWW